MRAPIAVRKRLYVAMLDVSALPNLRNLDELTLWTAYGIAAVGDVVLAAGTGPVTFPREATRCGFLIVVGRQLVVRGGLQTVRIYTADHVLVASHDRAKEPASGSRTSTISRPKSRRASP